MFNFALNVAEEESHPDEALKITSVVDFIVAGTKSKRFVDDKNSTSFEIDVGVKTKFERP